MVAGMTKKDMMRKNTENHLYLSTLENQLDQTDEETSPD